MSRITIIDYGMGNLRSVHNAFESLGFSARVTDDPRVAAQADHLVLPGVGAFKDCMEHLREGGFIEPIKAHVEAARPFLGICLGLQVLFSESEEFGRHQGLDIIPGRVVRFPADMQGGGEDLKVPHMGWNRITLARRAPICREVEDGAFVYFVHSYYVVPEDPGVVATTTDYGINFCSSIWRDNVMATQFHPEKSQQVGLRILQNFANM
ncbi:imidazole glycerol phosphate synthase subunit hisH [Geoalkalibacter ferrihydriticus]|uniref:Imidazole glycerol phosphate synthase subunit HisH n=2 Tax=Geoalkalibacter ferrihydriticus TaxID=392333 RepID=A0A0C2EBI0_9BACT|nr:imidazole glycerol phosphate synthase subunit HisH [Geoalkalibacter ferrihydriticus]KIH75948.1 imidazole glycerol phosphate synthase [Geoalkalibacter ferrihydriticus DSM 17813]SDM56557.1 imidazole glycerol phosphate synthase subunit hisH [Geoalkalibacter ferrihydriticus]